MRASEVGAPTASESMSRLTTAPNPSPLALSWACKACRSSHGPTDRRSDTESMPACAEPV